MAFDKEQVPNSEKSLMNDHYAFILPKWHVLTYLDGQTVREETEEPTKRDASQINPKR